jgi:UDP-N-acetylglucosamine/UDP-N-acetylgalactosamine diphosphorylase
MSIAIFMGFGRLSCKKIFKGDYEMTKEMAFEKLRAYGQEHVLKFFDELDSEEQSSLLEQIETVDFSVLGSLENYKNRGGQGDARGEFAPLAAMQRDEIESRDKELREIELN